MDRWAKFGFFLMRRFQRRMPDFNDSFSREQLKDKPLVISTRRKELNQRKGQTYGRYTKGILFVSMIFSSTCPLKAWDTATGKRWLASPQVNWGPLHNPTNYGQQGNQIWQGGWKRKARSWRWEAAHFCRLWTGPLPCISSLEVNLTN